MTEEIITILAQGGVAITTLIALYFVLQAISAFMGKNNNKNNNQNYNNLEKRVKKIENNDYHYLLSRVDRTDERLNDVETRLAKIENVLKDKL